jgi:ParB/RepB/Spo0J family partition protein
VILFRLHFYDKTEKILKVEKMAEINQPDKNKAAKTGPGYIEAKGEKSSFVTAPPAQAALPGGFGMRLSHLQTPTNEELEQSDNGENIISELNELQTHTPGVEPINQFKYIATDLIDFNPFYHLFRTHQELAWQSQPQIDKFAQLFTEGRLAEFVVLVRLHPENRERYQLVYGHLRLRGAILAGKKYLPAVVENLSDEEMLIRLAEENQQRQPITRIYQALQVQYLHDRFNWEVKDIAVLFRVPLSSCYDLYYISKAPQPFLNFLESRPEYYQSIAELVRRGLTIAQQSEMLELLETGKTSPRELKLKVREFDANNRRNQKPSSRRLRK